MLRACHIVAVGARTVLGRAPETGAAAVRAGISRIEEHPHLVGSAGEPIRCACDQALEADLPAVERMAILGEHALTQLAARLQLRGELSLPLLLALPEPRPGFTAADAQHIERQLARVDTGLRLRSVSTVSRGHAGALEALHLAVQAMSNSTEDICIVGGVESWLEPKSLAWLSRNGQLMGTNGRSAFFPGEGASFAVVTTPAARQRLRLPSLAVVRGTGVASEHAPIKSDRDNLGIGLTEAIRQAHQDPGGRDLIGDIYCDINGERYRAEEWGLAILRTSEWYRDPSAYVAPASQWGDLGAATGIALATLAIAAWQRGYARGSLAMLFAGSESGRRGAVLLERSGET